MKELVDYLIEISPSIFKGYLASWFISFNFIMILDIVGFGRKWNLDIMKRLLKLLILSGIGYFVIYYGLLLLGGYHA